jgi:hypothetical protein
MKNIRNVAKTLFLLSVFVIIAASCVSTPEIAIQTARENSSIISSGTGFFITGDGYVVTNAHVVDEANTIGVWTGGNQYRAELVAINHDTDVAILKINYRPSHFFRFADFNSAQRGDKVFVTGFPMTTILGSEISLTDGIINAFRGETDFQISAPVQPGNSGSPVFNERFEVLGVVHSKLIGDDITNINFAANNTQIISLLPQNAIIRGGNVRSFRDAERATVQISLNDIFDGPPVNIVNNTGNSISEVFISPSLYSVWGINRLGRNQTLNNAQSIELPLDLALRYGNYYDFRVVDTNGTAYTHMNVVVTPNSRIVFTAGNIAAGGASAAISGTYTYGRDTSITFTGNNFTLVVSNTTIQGTFSVSGSSLTLAGHNRNEGWIRGPWEIVNDNTLRDSDGDIWRKQAALSGTFTYGEFFSMTFSDNNFTAMIGGNNAHTGTYSVSGSTFTLTGHNSTSNYMTGEWIIVNDNTLRDADGDVWRRQ